MKLADYYRDYYDRYIGMLAPSTQEGYRSSIRLHVLPQWGEWELHEIRVRHINSWLMEFDSPGQADKAYKCLRQILRSSMGDEIYPEDVVDPTTRGIRKPKMPWSGDAPCLTEREVRELLLAIVGWEYEPLVICGVWMGLRRSEQCGLQWGDINLKTGVTHVQRGVQRVQGEIIVTEVKTHRSMRPMMLPWSGIVRMREIKRERRAKPGDWLMGDELDPERYSRSLKSLCKRKGLRYVAPKYLRHTFDTLQHKAGATDEEVGKMMGHVGLAVGYRYMSLDEDFLREKQKAYERRIMRA